MDKWIEDLMGKTFKGRYSGKKCAVVGQSIAATTSLCIYQYLDSGALYVANEKTFNECYVEVPQDYTLWRNVYESGHSGVFTSWAQADTNGGIAVLGRVEYVYDGTTSKLKDIIFHKIFNGNV